MATSTIALSPIVVWLQQRRVPRALSAALLVAGIVLGVVGGAWSLSDEASKLVELLPQATQKLNQLVHSTRGGTCSSTSSSPSRRRSSPLAATPPPTAKRPIPVRSSARSARQMSWRRLGRLVSAS